MTNDELKQLQRTWAKFTPRLLSLLEKWDGGRGLLFVAHDHTGDEAAPRLARHLTDDVITYCGERKDDWDKKLAFLTERGRQTGLFEKPPERVCVLVHELEHKPSWMHHSLKRVFEHYVRPCVLIATTQDKKAIPAWLSSHFHKVTKTGRPRAGR